MHCDPGRWCPAKPMRNRRVSPIDKRPSTSITSFCDKKLENWVLTFDMWHMTHDMWSMTRDMWHKTRQDRWGEVNFLPKCQLPSSYGLGVKVCWRYLHIGWLAQLIIQLKLGLTEQRWKDLGYTNIFLFTGNTDSLDVSNKGEGVLTNERPKSHHVILGQIRGLKNYVQRLAKGQLILRYPSHKS